MISLRSPRLSQKEITCVELLLQGKTAKEIAQCTGLSYRTIETRIHNLKVKFNAQNKSELIVKLLS